MLRNPKIADRIRWAAQAIVRPLTAGRARWAVAATAVTCGALFVATSGALAVVVNVPGTNNGLYGVALVPGTDRASLPAGMVATPGATCSDPWLSADLTYQPGMNQLCYWTGPVLKANETFALTWDPWHAYWEGTRGYVEQYLRDVADASASLNDPYALTTQYLGSGLPPASPGIGRAGNSSKYGGGCIDYGNPNGSGAQNTTCLFGSTVQTGPGNNYPTPTCPITGQSYTFSGSGFSSNRTCLTDQDLKNELAGIVRNEGIIGHLQQNNNPMVVMLLPPGVETCLDSAGTLCSANSGATVQFCSYHSHVNVDGTEIAYVVQPWTVKTACDEPDVDAIPANPPVDQLAKLAGERLVSPISQGEMAAITNPELNGWIAGDGSEINDNNGCRPVGQQLDQTTINGRTYYIQREWNNGAAIAYDPATYFGCAPDVILAPTFVAPSPIDAGDTVVFDGSATPSTLVVPNSNYVWDFGDGTGAVGPSVVHSYAKGGSFSVTLTVTDRGGNVNKQSETITVLGSDGLPVPPSNPPTTNPTNTGSSGPLQVRMQLLPQALHSVLRSGIKVQVTSTGPANGIAQVYISRAMAKRAHIKVGRGRTVVIGRGTLSQIKDGTVVLHLHLSHATATKLKHLKHAVLNVRLALVGVGGSHLAVVAAGRY